MSHSVPINADFTDGFLSLSKRMSFSLRSMEYTDIIASIKHLDDSTIDEGDEVLTSGIKRGSSLYSSSESSMKEEMRLVVDLAIPTILIQVAGVIPGFLTASYIGRQFGAVYLGGFMLANLTGNLCSLTLLQGIFSASDTLSPQAFGAGNYREVGLIAIRGYILSMSVIVPIVAILLFRMDELLQAVGEDADASAIATQWYRIYAISLPFTALQQVIWKFLSAQHIMSPLVTVCLTGSFVVLPILLFTFGHYFGFIGTAFAIMTYIMLQPISLLFYLVYYKPHYAETWTGFHWNEALQIDKFSIFLKLGLGGMLASSEWIYWEMLSLMIGTLGVVELSVHTIPTQVTVLLLMIPLAIGIALTIRIGNVLPRSAKQAKHLAFYGFTYSAILLAIMSISIYIFRFSIYGIFTSEQEIIDGAEQIWAKVSFYYFVLGLYAINMGIAIGLGKQWLLGFVTIAFLWVFGLPASYYFGIVQGGGLNGAWDWTWPPYIIINIILWISFIRADWEEISAQIRIREGVKHPEYDNLKLNAGEESQYGSIENGK